MDVDDISTNKSKSKVLDVVIGDNQKESTTGFEPNSKISKDVIMEKLKQARAAMEKLNPEINGPADREGKTVSVQSKILKIKSLISKNKIVVDKTPSKTSDSIEIQNVSNLETLALLEEHPLSLDITTYEILREQDGRDKMYVAYVVSLKKGSDEWKVYRRFNDFKKFHKVLLDHPEAKLLLKKLPKLPTTTFSTMTRSKFDPEFTNERRQGLEVYLQKVLALIEPEQCDAFDGFLEYAEHLVYAACRRLAGLGIKGIYDVVTRLRKFNHLDITLPPIGDVITRTTRPLHDSPDDHASTADGDSKTTNTASTANTSSSKTVDDDNLFMSSNSNICDNVNDALLLQHSNIQKKSHRRYNSEWSTRGSIDWIETSPSRTSIIDNNETPVSSKQQQCSNSISSSNDFETKISSLVQELKQKLNEFKSEMEDKEAALIADEGVCDFLSERKLQLSNTLADATSNRDQLFLHRTQHVTAAKDNLMQLKKEKRVLLNEVRNQTEQIESTTKSVKALNQSYHQKYEYLKELRKKSSSFGDAYRESQRMDLLRKVVSLRHRLSEASMSKLDQKKIPALNNKNVSVKELSSHSDKLLKQIILEASSVNTGEHVVLMSHISDLIKENAQLRLAVNTHIRNGTLSL